MKICPCEDKVPAKMCTKAITPLHVYFPHFANKKVNVSI